MISNIPQNENMILFAFSKMDINSLEIIKKLGK